MYAMLMICMFFAGDAPRPTGPLTETVTISDVDLAQGRFSIVRTQLEIATRFLETEVERDGKPEQVLQKVGVEERRLITEEYTIKYWRLVDKRGKEFDWSQAKGKVVIRHGDNQLPDRSVLQLLSNKALILYGRD